MGPLKIPNSLMCMVPLKFQFKIPHYCAHAILRNVAGLNQNTSAD